jgi:hypothetical protein
MNFTYTTREFYPDELQLLKKLKAKQIKESKPRFRFYHYLIAGIMGILFTYLAVDIKTGFLVFLFGTGAVFAYGFIVFMPFEMFKQRKSQKEFYKDVDYFIQRGTVDICSINAKRIAILPETEDEGDLFIIEYDNNKALYFLDNDYNIKEGFPCLDFEIYEDKFYKLIGTQIYPKGNPIQPITVDAKKMQSFFDQKGPTEHLSPESLDFDKFISDYNTSA